MDDAFIQNEQILVASVTDPVGGALKPNLVTRLLEALKSD